MEKSGITRRIDELGRIVIPKEIRKNLKIHDYDELDIFLDDESIILNKHEISGNDKVINMFLNIVNKYLDKNILFTSKDKIVSYSINKKDKIDTLELNYDIINIIKRREKTEKCGNDIFLFENVKYNFIVNPLIINGDILGSLILYSERNINDKDRNVLDFSKMFFENYLE